MSPGKQYEGYRNFTEGLFVATLLMITSACAPSVGDQLPELFLLDGVNPPEYSIGGSVSKLFGSGLKLQNEFTRAGSYFQESRGTDTVIINAADGNSATDDDYQFPVLMRTHDLYSISIVDHPRNPTQFCQLSNASSSGLVSGQIINDPVDNLDASCDYAYLILVGSITGLSGTGLTLENNGNESLSVEPGAIPSEFHIPVMPGSVNTVTIAAQPTDPWQTCLFNGTDTTATVTIASAMDETLPALDCTFLSFDVILSINGLVNNNLQITLNGGSPQSVAAGTLSFNAGTLNSGDNYTVDISNQPDGQNCLLSGGSGKIAGTNVHPSLACTVNGYLVGGTISSLDGSGLTLELRDGSNALLETITPVSGSYAFSYGIPYNSDYSITIATNPTNNWQTCTFDSSGGTTYNGSAITANDNTINITCVTNQYHVGGSTISLSSSGLELQLYDNGSSIESIYPGAGTGSFIFSSTIASGHAYEVKVVTQPSGLFCTASAASGHIAGSDISNVSIICTADSLTGTATIPESSIKIDNVPTTSFVATPGTSVLITLDVAVMEFPGCPGCILPLVVGIAGNPQVQTPYCQQSYSAGNFTYSSPNPPVYDTVNVSLTIPSGLPSGTYTINAWNMQDYCTTVQPFFTTQGAGIITFTVP